MRGRRENFGDLWLLIKESVTLIECTYIVLFVYLPTV